MGKSRKKKKKKKDLCMATGRYDMKCRMPWCNDIAAAGPMHGHRSIQHEVSNAVVQ